MAKFNWQDHPLAQAQPKKFSWDSMEKADAPAQPDAKGKFSWDKMEKAPEPRSTAGQAALEGFGNAASLGYLPQLQSLVEGALPNPTAEVDEKLRAQGFSVPAEQSYAERRDENIRRMQAQSQEHPLAAGAGSLAGGLATGIATAGLTPITAASRIGRVAQAAKAGALMGAVANPGDVEGEVASGLQLDERLRNAASGAAMGGVAQGGIETASKVAKALVNMPKTLQDKAAERAFKASGAMLKDYRRASIGPEDRVNVLGKYMLDKGLIKPGMSVEDIQVAAESLAGKHGEDVVSILERLDAAGADAPSAQGLSTLIQEEAAPLKDLVTAKPTYKALENLAKDVKGFSAKEPPIVISEGSVSNLPEKGTAFLTDPTTGDVIAKFQNGKIVAQGTPALTKEAAQAKTVITPSGIKAQATGGTFKTAQEIKKFIADQVEASGGWKSLSPTEKNKALQRAYTIVKSQMEEAAGKAAQDIGDPELLKSYLGAKSGFRNAEEIAKIAKDSALRNKSNRMISPSDYLTGIGGAITGAATGDGAEEKIRNALIGASLGGVNKLGRKYGNPLLSTAMYRGGKALEKLPYVAELGEMAAPILSKAERTQLSKAVATQNVSEPKLKGEAKWAASGAQKLGLSQAEQESAMKSPSLRRLLIEASDAPKGSKKLDQIRSEIKNRGNK